MRNVEMYETGNLGESSPVPNRTGDLDKQIYHYLFSTVGCACFGSTLMFVGILSTSGIIDPTTPTIQRLGIAVACVGMVLILLGIVNIFRLNSSLSGSRQ